MNVKQPIVTDFKETKRLIRNRIEREAESVFEQERRDHYLIGLIELAEEILPLKTSDKEILRIELNQDLKDYTKEIQELWEILVTRTAIFQIGVDLSLRASLILAILAATFRLFGSAFLLVIAFLVIFFFSKSKSLFPQVMYIVAGSELLSEKLMEKYAQYGRSEAALLYADYRNLNPPNLSTWIYTTSHKTSPP